MSLDQRSLDGKNVLVVGAGAGHSGMGVGISLALAQAGASVIALDRTDELVVETQRAVEALGRRCVGITADVLDRAQLVRALATAIARAGHIDGLVNVVGGTRGQWFRAEEYPDEVFDAMLGLNLHYVFIAAREVGRHMISAGIKGSIISIISGSSHSAPYHLGYGVAKAGVVSLTHSLATEWGPHGVRVNCINPGPVETRQYGPNETARADDFARSFVPLGRRTRPDDIGRAAVFLLSEAASPITGQVLNVDLGLSAGPTGGRESLEKLFETITGSYREALTPR